jgi:hypothetical protein
MLQIDQFYWSEHLPNQQSRNRLKKGVYTKFEQDKDSYNRCG